MTNLPALRPFCRNYENNASSSSTGKLRLDAVFLDTTYCDAKYTFPSQKESISAVLQKVVELDHPKTVFLFGTYSIGKERVFMEVRWLIITLKNDGCEVYNILGCSTIKSKSIR